jgi:hypothetical protein
LAKRKYRRFMISSRPRKWSMRKTEDSPNADRTTRLSCRAEARSRPNGFSTTTRAPAASPSSWSPLITVSNSAGGRAR